MSVVTRFAPRPTGLLHIGGVRAALFSWLQARRHGGQFIQRVEDTGRGRSTDEVLGVIVESMRWLGRDHDLGPYYQTQRLDRYREVIGQMLATQAAPEGPFESTIRNGVLRRRGQHRAARRRCVRCRADDARGPSERRR